MFPAKDTFKSFQDSENYFGTIQDSIWANFSEEIKFYSDLETLVSLFIQRPSKYRLKIIIFHSLIPMTYLEDVTDKQVISLRFQQYNLFYSQVLPDRDIELTGKGVNLGVIFKKIDVSISQHLTVVGFSANKWNSLVSEEYR